MSSRLPRITLLLTVFAGLIGGQALAGVECLDLHAEGPRGELCVVEEDDAGSVITLRMKQPGMAEPVEIRVELEEGGRLELDRVGKCDLADAVLVWLPISKEHEGYTLMFVYRIVAARWERLPVRWACRRRCSLQNVSYQTTLKGGPANTRFVYETEVNGQYLKSTYAWDGERLAPLDIEEPKSRDALSRGHEAPPVMPVCERTRQIRAAIEKKLKLPCEKIGPDELVRVTGLDLDRDGIEQLKTGDFSGLSEMTSLDLMNNPLVELPPGVFDGLFKLRSLTFQGCRLATVPEGIFKHLGSLKDLYLNHNRLTRLPPGAFEGLDALTFLSLNHNQLESLPPGIFKPLPKRCNIYLSNNKKELDRSF